MLQSHLAFSSFAVKDIKKARKFYGDVLGLTVTENDMGILEVETSGNQPIIIYPKPDHQPAVFTVLNFQVDDIEKTVDALTATGIVFEQYTGNIQTDAKGICRNEEGPQVAWFKDPEGNILSVLED
ncbi:VOC family protein [Echinicola vietnamensis]|uniref:Lactoylglutathione lyase family protein n=1 Tax=Echinicola vietnamensis (strain DSM 17526 / LMG 23754 / KMM 6221) TaxID=926556 RepID=L0FY56_ECHVK|nr:VOC family protein [Echinicola vietnamensis]AGA77686.1 lactoylglutathione lyase family protein [Echinicola vietnamensis DSM 17526]